LLDDNFWKKWLRKNSLWLFSTTSSFEEFESIENIILKELSKLVNKTPSESDQQRILHTGKKMKYWVPFFYGYYMSRGLDVRAPV
jgi:hypothetical protein